MQSVYSSYPMRRIDISDLVVFEKSLSKEDLLVVDVRTKQEFQEMHIRGALHIPIDTLPQHLDKFEGYKTIVLVCGHGCRARKASEYLDKALKTETLYLDADLDNWEDEGLAVQH